MSEQISMQDFLKYYHTSPNTFWVHGSVTSFVDDIISDGLLIRALDFPTVVQGVEPNEYEWYEPRGEGKSANVVIEIPKKVIEKLSAEGKPISQANVFAEIC